MTAATAATAAILEAGRERAGLTFAALAKAIGVDHRYVWAVVRGRLVASPDVAAGLAACLDLDDHERAVVVGLARAVAGLDPKPAARPASRSRAGGIQLPGGHCRDPQDPRRTRRQFRSRFSRGRADNGRGSVESERTMTGADRWA